MLSRAGLVVLAFAFATLAPSLASGADAYVGGKGPRMGPRVSAPSVQVPRREPHVRGPRVMGPDGHFVSNRGRPIFIVDDDFADFGDLQTATAPPLRIEVKGDVDIVPLENGGLRIRFVEK